MASENVPAHVIVFMYDISISSIKSHVKAVSAMGHIIFVILFKITIQRGRGYVIPGTYLCHRNCFDRPGLTYALYVPWFMGNRKRWCLSDIHVPAMFCTGLVLCATVGNCWPPVWEAAVVSTTSFCHKEAPVVASRHLHKHLIHAHSKAEKGLWGRGWKEVSAVIHICWSLLIISGLNLIWFVNDHVLMGTSYSKNLSRQQDEWRFMSPVCQLENMINWNPFIFCQSLNLSLFQCFSVFYRHDK